MYQHPIDGPVLGPLGPLCAHASFCEQNVNFNPIQKKCPTSHCSKANTKHCSAKRLPFAVLWFKGSKPQGTRLSRSFGILAEDIVVQGGSSIMKKHRLVKQIQINQRNTESSRKSHPNLSSRFKVVQPSFSAARPIPPMPPQISMT